ncbi:MAG: hypothetical protein P8Y97_24045, partial [Candidatus Lokiarchaeota archaeon]
MSTKKEAIPIAKKIVEKVLLNNNLLTDVYEAIINKKEAIRYPNVMALEELAEKIPEKIYPRFEYFFELTTSNNAFHRAIGISIIANLTKIDDQNKFDKIFDEFYNMMDDKSVMVTRKLVLGSGKIIKNKPYLLEKITERLLNIDKTHHVPNRSALIWGDIVEILGDNFQNSQSKEKIIEFAKKQVNSASPSTVKRAKAFL